MSAKVIVEVIKMNTKFVLLGLLAFALFVGTGYSDTGDETTTTTYCNGANFVDADADGICDNYGTGGAGFVDEDGDGVCDNRGSGRGGCSGGCGGYGKGPRRA